MDQADKLPAVLVFEPDLSLRGFLDRQLKRAGVKVYYATSLNEARDVLHTKPAVALAFVDLVSLREGLLLIREIYEDFPFMQSVAIVPEGQIRLLRQCMNRGAADFLIRPLSGKDFQEVLSNVMVSVHARREILRTRTRFTAVRNELEIAGKIQHAMLPAPRLDHEKIQLYASIIPASDTGGDLFDYFFLDSNRLAFLIGDVSGKGISAALFMAVSRSLLRSTGLQKQSPAQCLEKANYLLCQNNDAGMFVTVFYGIIDLEEGVLTYSNGGHNPPYVIRPGRTAEPLERTGDMALGVFEENTFHQRRVQLSAGDIIYLYTDGIVEAIDADFRFYGNNRLEQTLNTADVPDCRQLIECNLDTLNRFTGDMDQSDDITSMALKLI